MRNLYLVLAFFGAARGMKVKPVDMWPSTGSFYYQELAAQAGALNLAQVETMVDAEQEARMEVVRACRVFTLETFLVQCETSQATRTSFFFSMENENVCNK